MFALSAEKNVANYESFKKLVSSDLFASRQPQLKKMYDEMELEDRILMAPASGTEHYHNAIAGGYVDHVLRVCKFAKDVYKLWKEDGLDVSNFTLEELMFAALHHDLGKLGFPGDNNEYYTPNPSNWHVTNRGEIYTANKAIPHMKPSDRTLYLLNHYGIQYSINEMLGIKLADGLYDEDNRYYFVTYEPHNKLRSNLPYILHQADMMAARFEYERWAATSQKVNKALRVQAPVVKPAAISEFDQMFK